MITYSIIQKSQLEGALRLDAEYYQSQYLELVKNLNALGSVSIKDVATASRRKFKPQKNKYFEYIEISQINLSTGEYNKERVLGEKAPDRAQWIVKKDDVIISTVRPIRNAVSLIKEDNENLVCSSGFAVIESNKVEPEYLFTYLKSRPIVKLLDRRTTATMYPAITIKDILEMKIYLGSKKFREEIKNQVLEAQRKLEESQNFYSQAENLLLEKLGLKDFKIEDDLSYVVNFSDIKSAHRTDAEYFQPKYEKLLKVVSNNFQIRDIKEVFNLKRGIFIPTDYYTEEKTSPPYIRIKELAEKGGINKSEIVFINEKYSGNEVDKLKQNDLIIAIIGDTIGKTNKIDEDLTGGYCSNNTGRLRIKKEWVGKIIPEYNKILFQSIFIQSQIEQKKAQTAQPKINNNELKTIKVPVLPKAIQRKIADLVRQSHEARKKAKELLEEAKQKVEELIEKTSL